jgi:hypothetical protein
MDSSMEKSAFFAILCLAVDGPWISSDGMSTLIISLFKASEKAFVLERRRLCF